MQNRFKCLFNVKFSSFVKNEHILSEELPSKNIYVSVDESIEPQLKLLEPKTTANTKLDESDSEYWRRDAQIYMKNVLEDPRRKMKPQKAKNIILFMGDGMSLTTVAATRMYLGDEKNSLSFEQFPHFGLSKVWLQIELLLNLI